MLIFTLGPAPSVCCSQDHLWGHTQHLCSVEVYIGLTGLCCPGPLLFFFFFFEGGGVPVLLILTIPTVM